MMSISRRSLRRVFISCSGSRWIPTQQPFTNIFVALQKEKPYFKSTTKHILAISFHYMGVGWGGDVWGQPRLTLEWLRGTPPLGFPCSTPPRTPEWGTAENRQIYRPSGPSSSPALQHFPTIHRKVKVNLHDSESKAQHKEHFLFNWIIKTSHLKV